MKTKKIISFLLMTALLIAMSIAPAYAAPKQKREVKIITENGSVDVVIITPPDTERINDNYSGTVTLDAFVNETVTITAIPDEGYS